MDLVPKPSYQPFAVGTQVDYSSVLKALELAAQSSGRKLSKLLKDTALATAYKWQKATPAMNQGWIDNAMQVDVISFTNAGRNRISKAKRGTKFTSTPASPFLPAKAVPLGVLVIMARHRAGSRWNNMTDNRWSLAGVSLPGGKGSAKARQQQIAAELTRMIRSRHSSTHFLQHGITDIIKDLKRIGASGDGFVTATVQDSTGRAQLGFASASGVGELQWLKIENAIGTEGTPNLEMRRQYYLFAVAGLSLEEALAAQVTDMQAHYLPKVAGELAEEWKAL